MTSLLTAFQVNFSTMLFALLAGFIVWRIQHPGRMRFIMGLSVVCLSGLIAIPSADYFAESERSIIVLSNLIGMLHGAGLLICTTAFKVNFCSRACQKCRDN